MIRNIIKDINLREYFPSPLWFIPLGNLNCNDDCLACLGYPTVSHFSTRNWWSKNEWRFSSISLRNDVVITIWLPIKATPLKFDSLLHTSQYSFMIRGVSFRLSGNPVVIVFRGCWYYGSLWQAFCIVSRVIIFAGLVWSDEICSFSNSLVIVVWIVDAVSSSIFSDVEISLLNGLV